MAAAFEQDIGILLNGKERSDVEVYRVIESWVKVPAVKAVGRNGKPLLIKINGKVEVEVEVEAFYQYSLASSSADHAVAPLLRADVGMAAALLARIQYNLRIQGRVTQPSHAATCGAALCQSYDASDASDAGRCAPA